MNSTPKQIHTTLNGKPSDSIPFEDGQFLDAPYELCHTAGNKVAYEYVASITDSINRGEVAGVVHYGAARLEWSLK